VKAPERLLKRPYLRPVYDEPEFVVRNIWRLNAGWYDGNPANLKPAKDEDLAKEWVSLIQGGAKKVANRARELSAKGEHRLASHLIEVAAFAQPLDKEILQIRKDVYESRTDAESSLMAKGIFSSVARQTNENLEKLEAKL